MKNVVSEIWNGFFQKDKFLKRLIIVVLAVVMMGFSLSWLIQVDMGTDPCTMMNKAISEKLGLSLGNWQALLNIILLVIVIFFGGRNLGFGTLANMFLVGYSVDFFTWVINHNIDTSIFDALWIKIVVFVPALIAFVIAAAVYMDVDMGTAPYDAIPFIVSNKIEKIPFKVVRICYDMLVIIIAMCFGGRLRIVTLLMALLLGPVISWVGTKLQKLI